MANVEELRRLAEARTVAGLTARFVGSSEDEEAAIVVWPNAGDEISVWLEEDYRKAGHPDVYRIEALCSLPRPVAAALGQRLCELAEGPPPIAPCGRCGQPAPDPAGYFLGDPICRDCDGMQGWPSALVDTTNPASPSGELAALRRFRDAIDAASVAYHLEHEGFGRAVPRLDRAVRLALVSLSDDLDARDRAPAPPDAAGGETMRGRA